MLSLADIDRIVEEYGDAVVRARAAGFDGVELHMAHAYTLSSFLSRLNPRTRRIRRQYAREAPAPARRDLREYASQGGRRFPGRRPLLGDECIKDGYTVVDAKVIGVRLAAARRRLCVAVGRRQVRGCGSRPGQVLYPYTGYSGDRCMPSDWYPNAPHVQFSAEVKAYVQAHGYDTPVATTGKITDPDVAEQLLVSGAVDVIGIARGLLADPDMPKKVRAGERDRVIRCDYCNVCKDLDETHNQVVCSLWPQGALQAPADDRSTGAPQWGAAGANLQATVASEGVIVLKWNKAPGAARYDVMRSDDLGNVSFEDAVKVTRWEDHTLLAGSTYRYYVRPYAATGQGGVPSNTVVVDLPRPAYMPKAAAMAATT